MLTLEQRDVLSQNLGFIARVRAAVRQHAAQVRATVKDATPQREWATALFANCHNSVRIGTDVVAELCAQDAVIATERGDGSDISDEALVALVASLCENYK